MDPAVRATATVAQPAAPVRFRTFGAGGQLAQVGRIREGLLACGALEADADHAAVLVYANDAGTHEEAIAYRAQHAPAAKLVLNVLDIPEHCAPPRGDYTPDKLVRLQSNLLLADAITAISPFTRSQIQRLLGLGAYLIYNPVKDVSPDIRLSGQRPYPYKVLIGGRSADGNKRVRELAIPALIAAGYTEQEVAVVGGEWPGWGTNLGVVSDATLNDLLNSVDITMNTVALTGLELMPLESMICGAVPILCYDMSTFRDLGCYPQHWGCYPSVTSIAYRLRVLMETPQVLAADREHCLGLSDQLREQLGKRAVAQRILDVYKRTVAQPPSTPSP